MHLEVEVVRISDFCVAGAEGSLWAQISSLCSQAANFLQRLPLAGGRLWLFAHSRRGVWLCHSHALSQHGLASSPSAPGRWCKCTSCFSRTSRHPAGGAGPFPGHQPACSQPEPSCQPRWVPPSSCLPPENERVQSSYRPMIYLSAWLSGRALSQTPYDLLTVGTWRGLFKGLGRARPLQLTEGGQEESGTLRREWRRSCCWPCLGSALPTTLTMWATCTSCTQNCESPCARACLGRRVGDVGDGTWVSSQLVCPVRGINSTCTGCAWTSHPASRGKQC